MNEQTEELHPIDRDDEYRDIPLLDRYKIYNSAEYKEYIRMKEQEKPNGKILSISNIPIGPKEDGTMFFIDNDHRMRVANLLAKAELSITQIRITPVFYIIGGCKYLYDRVDSLYDFESHSLNADALFNGLIPVSTQEWKLYALALALADESYVTNLYDMFDGLSDERMDVAVEALKIRFTPICFMNE